MFRDPELLRREHPTYRMISTPVETLKEHARTLTDAVAKSGAGKIQTDIAPGSAYLGSGSLPTEAIPSVVVAVRVDGLGAMELARRLRMDPACVFGRIEADRVRLDMRTITAEQLPDIAAALVRVAGR
jgi:L-seryl-tRNA(Ser) seleniumtransferase